MNPAIVLLAALLLTAPAVSATAVDAVPAAQDARSEAPRCTGLPCEIINAVCQIVVHRNCVA